MSPSIYRVKLIMHDLEAVAHEIIQVEILGHGEALIGKVEHLDPVQDEHSYYVKNLLSPQKQNPTSSSEMGFNQISKPYNLLAIHLGVG
jgi:hypothetical protein